MYKYQMIKPMTSPKNLLKPPHWIGHVVYFWTFNNNANIRNDLMQWILSDQK